MYPKIKKHKSEIIYIYRYQTTVNKIYNHSKLLNPSCNNVDEQLTKKTSTHSTNFTLQLIRQTYAQAKLDHFPQIRGVDKINKIFKNPTTDFTGISGLSDRSEG